MTVAEDRLQVKNFDWIHLATNKLKKTIDLISVSRNVAWSIEVLL